MKFSIVIPTYDKFHLTSDLLMGIYQNCPGVDEVIAIDNGGKEKETCSGFKFWQRVKDLPLTVLRLEENIGFLRASNLGLRQATGDIVALISNDVRIHKDLPKLTKEIIKTPADKVLLGGKVYDFDTGWNCFDGKIYPYVEGWLLIATRQGWAELGYFDELYIPNDYEDVDLSTTAISKGYEIKQFPPYHGEVATHVGSQTIGYNDARMAITLTNKEKFAKKWITKASL